ncbi:hypothetical protein FB451DRAFT_1048634, partial [Mycena latifolia]
NVAQNAATRFELQPNSRYTKYLDFITERMWTSQIPSSMSTEESAKRVAAKALGANPPFYLTLGSHTVTVAILKWLPRMWVLNYMYKNFAMPASCYIDTRVP